MSEKTVTVNVSIGDILIKQLGEKLAVFFADLDPLDEKRFWWHLIASDFKCGCRFENDWEEGSRLQSCPEWRWIETRVEDNEYAEVLAYREADYRKWNEINNAWRAAHELNRLIDNITASGIVKPEGVQWSTFVERLMP